MLPCVGQWERVKFLHIDGTEDGMEAVGHQPAASALICSVSSVELIPIPIPVESWGLEVLTQSCIGWKWQSWDSNPHAVFLPVF